MSVEVYAGFCLTSLLLAAAPGPDNLFVLAQSAVHGVRSGLLVVCGLCCGLVIQTLCAALGLAAVVAAVPPLFMGIRLAGAAYLLYLAYLSVKHARDPNAQRQASSKSGLKLVGRGFIMNITNPKVQIFFLAFFPQFVSAEATGLMLALQMVILGLTFIAATAIVFGAVAACAGMLSEKLYSPAFSMWLNYCSAVLFTILAVLTVVF